MTNEERDAFDAAVMPLVGAIEQACAGQSLADAVRRIASAVAAYCVLEELPVAQHRGLAAALGEVTARALEMAQAAPMREQAIAEWRGDDAREVIH